MKVVTTTTTTTMMMMIIIIIIIIIIISDMERKCNTLKSGKRTSTYRLRKVKLHNIKIEKRIQWKIKNDTENRV